MKINISNQSIIKKTLQRKRRGGDFSREVDLGALADTDGNGREQVPTEMVQLDLTGNSPMFGPMTLRLRDPALNTK